MRPLNALPVVFVTTLALSAQSLGSLEVAYRANGALEGPTTDADGNVYFSNRGAGSIQKLDTRGRVTTFREVRTNGLAFDPQFRLLVVETGPGGPTGTSRLTRVDIKTGNTEVLADSYEGKPFRGTNDVTFDGRGRIWFTNDLATDPGGVYRIDAGDKLTRVLSVPTDVQYPNGLMVSPDDRTLYVLETNGDVNGHRTLAAFDLSADGSASNYHVLHNFYPGRGGDGMTVDSAGNLWVAAGQNHLRASQNGRPSTETLDTKAGLYEFAPDGKQLNFYPCPTDLVTNVAFGGPDLRTIYFTGGSVLYKMRVTTPGTRR
jgi:gluconolactonase